MINAAGEFWAWSRRRRRRFRVHGRSMLPTLTENSFVLIDPGRTPRLGDVVVVNHPSKPITIVKRVAGRSGDGSLDLRSDNDAEGVDSREFGLVNDDRVVGVVTLRLTWPFQKP